MTRPRRLCCALTLFVAPLLAPDPAGAQQAAALSLPRLFAVPALGLAREANRPSFDLPAMDAWTIGGQLEYATSSAWTPLIAAHRWHFDRACDTAPICEETGWSAEGGVTRRLPSTRVVHPYAGAVAGVHHVKEALVFVQGRAGVDLVPPRSPIAFRVEARLHRPMAQRTEIGQFFVLTTGLRIALPGR